ncbi:MAG: inositol monophosphatase [Polyangiaceae bacterium]|nr:inositol monophosphatase [Polyangiaceae bacterium]
MPSALLTELSVILHEVVSEEILPRYQKLSAAEVIAKPSAEDPSDLVTLADRAAEERFGERLPDLVPGSVVVGEEATAADPSLLERLGASDPVWVVDPLDGTRNFASGHGPFGTMVVLVERGELLASGIYLPLEELLLTAERGRGAFMNGAPIAFSEATVAMTGPLSGSIYARFLPSRTRAPLIARAFGHTLVPGVACAAAEYAALALHRKDYVVYHRLLPWDHAPGALLVREAGGVVRHPDGRDYSVFDSRELLLAAPDAVRWARARDELFAERP